MAEEPSKDPITSLLELKELLYTNIAKQTKYEVKSTPKPLSEQIRPRRTLRPSPSPLRGE